MACKTCNGRRDRRPVPALAALVGAAALVACAHAVRRVPPGEPSADVMAQLWVDPGDVTSRDLFHGAGGREWMPQPGQTFEFVKEDRKGFSPGWDVKDERGVEWSVKYGLEAQSETVASRIVWAMGYHQPPVYYVERWSMRGGPSPGPQTASRFRPSVPGRRRVATWSWHQNPFVGTRPYKGLLVLMRILNNWDLLAGNNVAYDLDRPADGAVRWYVVRDLGASLGRTLIVPTSGTRNDVEDFERQGFVNGVEDGTVEFDDLGRWHRELFEEITPEDVRWICERLGRLTPRQWEDAFRAAGYEEAVARRYIRKIQDNVAKGLALGGAPR